jgi:hypothetical protein
MRSKLQVIAITASAAAILCFNAQADVRQGLVSYWPMDTVNGNVTPDLAFGNHLVLNNLTAANLVPGKRGSAFQLNGTSQYLGMVHTNNAEMTNNAGLPIYSAKRFTVSMSEHEMAQAPARRIFSSGLSMELS